MNEYRKINILQGMTLQKILVDRVDNEITFVTIDNRIFRLLHTQHCCESVYIEDIEGDMDDLLGLPLLIAEEVSNQEIQATQLLLGQQTQEDQDISETWTFYRLATAKGWVVLRWYGTSNGYYSEEVDFLEITPNNAHLH